MAVTETNARAPDFVGHFFVDWRLATCELVIVALGVLIVPWADQALQVRQEATLAVSYLECLQIEMQEVPPILMTHPEKK